MKPLVLEEQYIYNLILNLAISEYNYHVITAMSIWFTYHNLIILTWVWSLSTYHYLEWRWLIVLWSISLWFALWVGTNECIVCKGLLLAGEGECETLFLLLIFNMGIFITTINFLMYLWVQSSEFFIPIHDAILETKQRGVASVKTIELNWQWFVLWGWSMQDAVRSGYSQKDTQGMKSWVE